MRDQMANPRPDNEETFDDCALCQDMGDRRWNRVGEARVCDECHPKLMQYTAEVDPGKVVVRRFAIFSTAAAVDDLEMPPGVAADPELDDVWTWGVATRITEVAQIPPSVVLGELTLLEKLELETPYADCPIARGSDLWFGLVVKRKAPFQVASVVIQHSGATMTLVYGSYEEFRVARAEWEAMRLEKPAVPRRLKGVPDAELRAHHRESSATFAEWLAWSQDQSIGPDPSNC